MKLLFTLLLSLHYFVSAFPQCQEIEFSVVNDNLCLHENLQLDIESYIDGNYEWDFCSGELDSIPTSKIIYSNPKFNVPVDISIIEEEDIYYGFICSRGNNIIYVLNFGDSPRNSPIVINEIIASDFSGPEWIEFVKQGSDWVAFVLNFNDANLLRLHFTNGFTHNPNIESLGNMNGILDLPRGLEIQNSLNNYYLFISDKNKNHIVRVELEGNWLGRLMESSIDSIGVGSDLNGPIGISLIDFCDNWYGIVSSNSNNKYYHLDFGTNLSTEPVITEIGSAIKPTDIKMVVEAGQFYGLGVGAEGNFYRISFADTPGMPGTIEDLGDLNGDLDYSFGFEMVKDSSNWQAFSMNYKTKELIRLDFPNSCSANVFYSKSALPNGIHYQNIGPKVISLNFTDQNGKKSSQRRIVYTNGNLSEYLEFQNNENKCRLIDKVFNGISSNDLAITSWQWDFGDDVGTSTIQNPSYQYQNPGDYQVSLSVEAENGCTNFVSDSIYIYNTPIANFSYPETIICSNNEIVFQNDTEFSGPDSLLSFQWNVNDESVFDSTEISYTFTSGGIKDITLTAYLTGCISESTKSIDITPGPLTSFSFNGLCLYDSFSFTNNTTGDEITSYLWDFGDGYFSSNESPNHQYASGGNYVASLTASNALGCNTILEQVVSVRHIPELFFTNHLACSDNSVSLSDQSTVTDANITQRDWAVEKEDIGFIKLESGPSPSFDLEDPGIYLATLIAESNYGCADTLIRQIEVLQSPVADFTFNNTCFGDSVVFSQNSALPAGSELLSADWLIDGNAYTAENIKHSFQTTGDHTIELYVRADNYCTDNIAKTLTINPLPEIDFSLSSNCEDELVSINSSFISPEDPVTSYNWLINNKAVSNKEEFRYDFKKAEDYAVALHVATENNCLNSINKNIPIYPSPIAKFDAYPFIGASPLRVQFTDRSQGADTLFYYFSQYNEDGSSDYNPAYIYYEIGEDLATQIAKNNYGCTDTSTQSIEVVIPVYDIAITNVRVDVVDDELKFKIGLQNNGTIIIKNPILTVKISDKISLTQKVESMILPHDYIEYTMDFNLIKREYEFLDYICFSVDEIFDGFSDANPFDNDQCINIDQSFNVLEPFPNPSRTYVQVPVILPNAGECDLQLIGEQGSIVYAKKFSDLKSGLNMIHLDLAPYRNGIYLLTVKLSDFETTKKIVLQ